ncbi:MAG: Mov34/MPN/PAD-1 family protein [Candidatus Hodarchaeota archaeon]
MLEDQSKSIYIQIDQDMFDTMLEEAELWPGKETGGIMFGHLSIIDSSLEIEIQKTHIPLNDFCLRNSAYFEIDPDYAKEVVGKERLQYLGNWHKHLGYGGPSQGDIRQIKDFFIFNPHLNTVVTFILNFYSNNNYEVIIEVYERLEAHNDQKSCDFKTFRVPQSNISFFKKKEMTKEKIDNIKNELVNIPEFNLSLEDINDLEGHTAHEKIISFPFRFVIKNSKERKKTLELLILISFPPNFPEGDIFIDVSSKDLSRNFTFEKHPAGILEEDDLVQPFLLSLKSSLEEEVPILLKKPLWKVMDSSK